MITLFRKKTDREALQRALDLNNSIRATSDLRSSTREAANAASLRILNGYGVTKC